MEETEDVAATQLIQWWENVAIDGIGSPCRARAGSFGLGPHHAVGWLHGCSVFPDPAALAGRVATRLSRASIEVPFVIVIDDADLLDPAVCDAFLTGLVDRLHGQVLAVVAADSGSALHARMRSSDRFGPAHPCSG